MPHYSLKRLLAKIQKGKVVTYKTLGEKLNMHPRAVGKLLSQNTEPVEVPCHRVVHSSGRLGGYAFGAIKKKMLLRAEGIEIKNNKIDIKKYLLSKL